MYEALMKKYLLIPLSLVLSGCATNNIAYSWEKSFDSGVSLAQAESQCEYEYQLQRNADSRAGYQRGALQIWQELRSHTNPTIVACMNRFGFKAKSFEIGEAKQTQKEPTLEDDKRTEELRVAAEKGDVVAQVNLAYNYLNGKGVYKSPKQAYFWYSIAVKKIDTNKTMARNAQANLGHMWQNGIHQEKNNTKAMMWYILASDNDEAEATKRRKALQELMLEKDYQEAKRLANACISKNYTSCDD